MLQHVADSIHLPDYAIEKDWWVTMVLKALFETDCAPFLEFRRYKSQQRMELD